MICSNGNTAFAHGGDGMGGLGSEIAQALPLGIVVNGFDAAEHIAD